MGKNKRFILGNASSSEKSQGSLRKTKRKLMRKQEKINNALNYAKSKNTKKVCISSEDLKHLKVLQSKTDTIRNPINISSSLENKILANDKNANNCNSKGKTKKNIKRKSKNFKNNESNLANNDMSFKLKNEDNLMDDDSSFKMSSSSTARLARLQEFVNKESQKMKDKNNNNHQKQQVDSAKKTDNLIKDKVKIRDLLEGQKKDEKEFNQYARKLHMVSFKKNNLDHMFEDNFGSLLQDIENGEFEHYKHEAQKASNLKDNFESDIMSSLGKKLNDDSPQKSKTKKRISKQNRVNNSGNSKLSESDEEIIIESDEEIIIDSDEEIESDKGVDDSENETFLDDEAEEVSEDEDDDNVKFVDNDEDLMFESGSCLTSNECSTINRPPPTINSIFDFYEKKIREEEEEEMEEEEDSDLDGFIVNDDYVEYTDEDEKPLIKNKKKKKSRIIDRESLNESDIIEIEDDEAEKNCNRKLKRRRILSESENEESDLSKKKLCNSKIFDDESFEIVKEISISKKSILSKDGSKDKELNLNCSTDEDGNRKPEKHVTFLIPKTENKENVSSLENFGECREDIYGRLRDKDGNIVNTDNTVLEKDGKYVPPAMRKLMALNNSAQKKEQLAQLKKKLNGQLNRLAESNMAGILSQIEMCYQSNSRNDMNDTLTKLLFEMLVTPVMTPERLVQDHALLVSVLSANIGNEVGAHILTEFVLKWVEDFQNFQSSSNLSEVESKELDNMLMFICQLYNFKVVGSLLIYNILHKILERNLNSKEAGLVLLVLKSVGFVLRKDDPLALKSLITEVNMKASDSSSSQSTETFSRVKFMLEILTAIRNNNMSKVPNYDDSHSEHLKTLMKGFVRKGCRPSELKISLEDLIRSKLVGKWWIVGSAWSGGLKERNLEIAKDSSTVEPLIENHEKFSEKFMEKAAKLHMSRPPRLNILYVLTEGAESFEDSFEKLMELKLPSNQEKEIFNVHLYCCMRCKSYREFYNNLALKFIRFNKRFARLLQFSLWDIFKELDNMNHRYCSNLAKFVSNMIAEDGLNLGVFKKINFAETGEGTVSFLRQALLGIFLHPSGNYIVSKAFDVLCENPKLKSLRQYIRLFIVQFITKHKTEDKSVNKLLKSRAKIAIDLLETVGGVKL